MTTTVKNFADLVKQAKAVFRENQIRSGGNEVTVIAATVHVTHGLSKPTLKKLFLEVAQAEATLEEERIEPTRLWKDLFEDVVQSCVIGTLNSDKDIASEDKKRRQRNNY